MFSHFIWSYMGVYAGFLTHLRTKTWVFHTQWMSWGVCKTRTFENCLDKFGCIIPHVKISFFLRFALFCQNNLFKYDSGPNLLVKFILCHGIEVYKPRGKNLNWGLMQNVSSVAISVCQLLLHKRWLLVVLNSFS